MATLVLDTDNATPAYRTVVNMPSGEEVGTGIFVTDIAVVAAVSSFTLVINAAGSIAHNIVLVHRSGTSLESEPLDPGESDFLFEKEAFRTIPEHQLARYEGMFVASRNGGIVDSDAELAALTDRFFTRFGDVPVYMTRIGQEPDLRVDTPFFE